MATDPTRVDIDLESIRRGGYPQGRPPRDWLSRMNPRFFAWVSFNYSVQRSPNDLQSEGGVGELRVEGNFVPPLLDTPESTS